MKFEQLEARLLLDASDILGAPGNPPPASGADLSIGPGDAAPGYVLQVSPTTDEPLNTAGPTGVTPSQMRTAYGVNQITFNNGTIVGDGAGQTIAIVDAYDDPTAAIDLHAFDQAFGLADPPSFQKLSQTGSTALPQTDPANGWEVEESLDIEWSHVMAPAANIVLVEANSNSNSNLYTADQFASSLPGVVVVSNSWGESEFSGETSSDSNFLTPAGHAGVTVVFSSGDGGKNGEYPAYSPNVVSVGGTTLTTDAAGNYVSESGWSGSGGGISVDETQPSYQSGVVSAFSITQRTEPDVSMDADPNTGVPVYDSYNFGTTTPWAQYGGTSLAAPMFSALIAIADQGRTYAGLGSLDGPSQTLPRLYSLYGTADFHDVTTGNNGYAAGTGYDLVTGLGSPVANLLVPALTDTGGMSVVGATPAVGSVVSTPVTQFSLYFSDAVNAASVSPGEFTVNGIAATSDTVSGTTVTFNFDTSPLTSIGQQAMSLAGGTITRIGDGSSVAAFNANFRYDPHPISIASVSSPTGAVAAPPLTTLTVNYSEPFAAASIGTSNLSLSQGAIVGFSIINGTTVAYTLSGVTQDGTLSINMAAGAVTDTAGDPGAASAASLVIDVGVVPFPTPLASVGNPATLILSQTTTGSVGFAGDTDSYTLPLDGGQTLTDLLTPAAGLEAHLTLTGPGGVSYATSSPAAGSAAILESMPISVTGTYTVTVSGLAGGTGSYTLEQIVNAAVEGQPSGGPPNNSLATAQDLGSSFFTLSGGGSHGGVLGNLLSATDQDWYSFSIAAGQSVSLAAIASGAGGLGLTLTDSAGTALATGSVYGTATTIEDFIAPSTGTYYVQVTGTTATPYSLVIQRDANLDLGGDGTLAGVSQAVGSLGPASLEDFETGNLAAYTNSNPATASAAVTSGAAHDGRYGLALEPPNGSQWMYRDDAATQVGPGDTLSVWIRSEGAFTGRAYFGFGSSANGTLAVDLAANTSQFAIEDWTNLLSSFTYVSYVTQTYQADSWYRVQVTWQTDGTIVAQLFGDDGLTLINSVSASIPGAASGGIGFRGFGSTNVDFDSVTIAASNSETYAVQMAAGAVLGVSTTTPGDGGELANELDPQILVLNSAGVAVAGDDNSAPDGRNAQLSYAVPAGAGGTYYIRVMPSSLTTTATAGAYVLSVSGTLLNAAPTLNTSSEFSLAPIAEDTTNNPGTLVSSLLASGAGGNPISDSDPGAVQGIAVTAVDDSNGSWQYSTDNGATWTAFDNPNARDSQLLAADANTRVRFVPNQDYNGSPAASISFRAWDQTSGVAGGLGDTSVNGGSTAFSAALGTATITITPVNDPPVMTAGVFPIETFAVGWGVASLGLTGIAYGPGGGADEANQTLIYTVTAVPNAALGTIVPAGSLIPLIVGQTLSLDTLQGLRFAETPGEAGGNGTFGFTATDNGTTDGQSDPKSLSQSIVLTVDLQNPLQLFDINTTVASSTPSNLVNVGGTLFFNASNPLSGIELWKTDGTSAGTVMVDDINPGLGSSSPSNLVNVGGTLFFSANDGTHGGELWESDGTSAGTRLIDDIDPGSASSSAANLTNVNGTLFFTANDGTHGVELWKSDGTSGGTMLVDDIDPGSASSSPSSLTNVNGTLFFVANDGTHGSELWESNGTSAGTFLVDDIDSGSASSSAANLTNVNGTLFFSANDGTHGSELWELNGTSAGTFLVDDIFAGSGSSAPASLTNVNGILFFAANDGTHGTELWESNGTSAGTFLVRDIFPGSGGSAATNLTNVNGTLFFSANDGTHGLELWKSDGTSAGTALADDIYAGTLSSNPNSLTNVGGTLFFVANDGTHGTELWEGNGTSAGTVLVDDISPGASGSSPTQFMNVSGTLFFQANDGTHGAELWESNGTSAGTLLVDDITTGDSSSNPTSLVNVAGELFFAANDGTHGIELWKTNGTATGTVLVDDIYSGTSSSLPANLTNVNGTLFFTANDGTHGIELWKSDGTSTGTVLVKDIDSGTASSSPALLTNVNGTLFFFASDGTATTELWKSDGTSAGTVLVDQVSTSQSGQFINSPIDRTNINGIFYFDASDSSHGIELWRSDGTSAGTFMVYDAYVGSSSGDPAGLTNVNGTLFFTDFTGVNTYLYTSNGTSTGTTLISTNDGAVGGENLVNLNGVVLYNGFEPTNSHGFELWRSDGTVAGTYLVDDIDVGGNSFPTLLTNVNGIVYFAANDGTHGEQLWKTDGTSAGTSMVPGALTASTTNTFSNFTNVNGLLFFDVNDGVHGNELWSSNGTAAGTMLAADLLPGSAGSNPASLTAINNTLYFSAIDPTHGIELWQYSSNPPSTSGIGNVNLAENAAPTVLNLFSAFSDSVTPDANMTYTVVGDTNPGLFTSLPIDPLAGTLTLNYRPNSYGTAMLTIQATNGAGRSVQTSFNVTISSSDTAPVLNNSTPLSLAPIAEGATTNSGTLVSTMLASGAGGNPISDPDSGAVQGVAVIAADTSNGSWQFSLDDGASWSPLGSVSATSGLLLPADANTLVRFVPNGYFVGTAALSVRAWDQTTGLAGGYADTTTSGGATAFSSATVAAVQTVTAVNQPPILTAGLLQGAAIAIGSGVTSLGLVSLNFGPGGGPNEAGQTLTYQVTAVPNTAFGTIVLAGSLTPVVVGQVLLLSDVEGLRFDETPGEQGGTTSFSFSVSDNGTTNGLADPKTLSETLPISINHGPAVSLVTDINSTLASATIGSMVNVGGLVFFSANDGVDGAELWRSDGTVIGTYMVEDINPGIASSSPSFLTNVNGTLFFTAADGTHGTELWKSDGTASGTVMVDDIYSGAGTSSPANLTNVGGELFFSANDGTHGTELWESDGSSAGTHLVDDIYAGGSTSSPANLTNVGGELFFTANDGSHGVELWESNGTSTGTQLVDDINPGSANSSPTNLTAVGNTLFFQANDGSHGAELWESNGTSAGTLLVNDINSGVTSSTPTNLVNVNGTLFFQANDGTHGIELWKSDGTSAGTVLVRDILSGGNSSSPANLTNVNGLLFFSANDGTHGTELWTSDGTSTGTVLVDDINPGVSGSAPFNLTNLGGTLFFSATDSTHGNELWESNGTSSGTTLVRDIIPGVSGSLPGLLTAAGNSLFFQANDGVTGTQLWTSNGTSAGTTLVKVIAPGTASSSPKFITNVNGELFFQANDGLHGAELWKSNGTATGTVMVDDILAGLSSSSPANLTNVNGTLFFEANDGTHGFELWKSDGTSAGTVLVADIDPGTSSSSPSNLTALGNTLFFQATDGTHGFELWKSDGTSAGTVLVDDINPGSGNSSPANLTAVGSTLFFAANDGTHGSELWKSDGTSTGTVMVDDINPGANFSFPSDLTNLNGTLLFEADGPTSGDTLWTSDGTSSGTVMVNTTFASGGPFANVNGTVFFEGSAGSTGYELWKTDGTSSGTALVDDIDPGSSSSLPSNLTVVGNSVFFTANDGTHGVELWTSDGTSTGTMLVSDIYPGATTSSVADLVNVNGTLDFRASDGVHGLELWRSDGTSSGTQLVADIDPGVFDSDPTYLANVNGVLYFNAVDGTHGAELWQFQSGTASTTGLANVQAAENAPPTVIPLAASFNDTIDASSNLTYSIVGDTNSSLFAGLSIDSAGNLTLQYAPGVTGSSDLTIRATDSTGSAVQSTFNVLLGATGPNQAPVNSIPAAQNVSQNATLVFSSTNHNAISVSDADAGTNSPEQVTLSVSSGTLTLSGTSGLNFSQGTGVGNAAMTFSGTLASINAALAGLAYRAPQSPGAVTLSLTTNDLGNTGTGGPLASASSITIQVAPVAANIATNEAPLIYLPGSAPQDAASALTISDAGSSLLNSATVSISSGYMPGEDVLTFVDQNGISGSFDAGSGVLALSGAASLAAYQDALEFVLYTDASATPTLGIRKIQFEASDGTTASPATSLAINVGDVTAPVNQVPGPQSVPQNSSLDLDSTLSIADSDLLTDSVQVTLSVSSGALTFGSTSGLSFTLGTGSSNADMVFTGTLEDINAALNNLSYQAPVVPGSATLTLSTDDLGNTASGVPQTTTSTVTIQIMPVAPQLSTSISTLAYTESSGPVAIDSGLSVTDAGNPNLSSATVTIGSGYVPGEDLLSFQPEFGIDGSFDPALGVLTLSGVASVADYQAALQSITYTDTVQNSNTTPRSITFSVSDGTTSSATATVTIDVAPGPAVQLVIVLEPASTVAAGSSFGLTVTAEDAGGDLVSGFSGSVTVSLASNSGGSTLGGTLVIDATAGVAVFSDLSLSLVGEGYTLGVGSDSLASATTSAIAVTPGAATQLFITAEPATTVAAGSPFGITVTAEDAEGNIDTNFNGSETVVLAGNSGSGALDGTLTLSATSGVASFDDLALDTIGAGYTLQVSAGSLTSAASGPVTVTPGTVAISGTSAGASDNVEVTFIDPSHFEVTADGVSTTYSTANDKNLVYNGPSGTFSEFVFDDPQGTYTAEQSLSGTKLVSSSGFEIDLNDVTNLYVYVASSGSTATVTVPGGAGSNFFVGAADGDYSYIADPITGQYSELAGFGNETVIGSGGSTYAYIYSTSHATTVGDPAGTKFTAHGSTVTFSNFPQFYVVGAADGSDSVTLDSAGGSFVSSPGFSYVSGTSGGNSFLIGALYAANVSGDAAGSSDTATFYSYPGNTFNGTPGISSLSGNTANIDGASVSFVSHAIGFDSVAVFESGTGSDVANLTSPGNGSFFSTSTAGALSVGSSSITVNTFFVNGSGQIVAVSAQVNVTGQDDGTDMADIFDAPGTNSLTAANSTATLTTSLGSLSIDDFGSVSANQQNGDDDTIHSAAIDFALQTVGNWIND